jgi:predicted CopG family antitoxin
MARTISVSDDVYEWMKRKKGDRSFSELIRSMSKETDFEELKDLGIADNWDEVEEVVREASDTTLERIEDDYK